MIKNKKKNILIKYKDDFKIKSSNVEDQIYNVKDISTMFCPHCVSLLPLREIYYIKQRYFGQ